MTILNESPPLGKVNALAGYIKMHWSGGHSLPRSYWINGVLVMLPMNVSTQILTAIAPVVSGRTTFSVLAMIVAIGLLSLPHLIWWIVGTFRTSLKRLKEKKSDGWAITAVIVVSFNCLMIPVLITNTYAVLPALKQHFLTPADFDVIKMSSDEIQLVGMISYAMIDEYQSMSSGMSELKYVQVNSQGGMLEAAHDLRDLIAESHLTTITQNGCYSACTLVFSAGDTRFVMVDAKLGFHKYGLLGDRLLIDPLQSVDQDLESTYEDDLEFFAERGISEGFIERLRNEVGEEIWEPTNLELLQSGFATHVWSSEHEQYIDLAALKSTEE